MTITGLGWPALELGTSMHLLTCGYVKRCYAQIFGLDPAALHLLSGYRHADDAYEGLGYSDLLAYSCDSPTGA